MSEINHFEDEIGYQRGGLKVTLRRVDGWTSKGVLQHPFVFQCPPMEEFTVQHSFSHSDYETLGAGQQSRPGTRQLRRVQFNTLFVDYWPPWSFLNVEPLGYDGRSNWRRKDTINPKESALVLEQILNTGTPFRLTVNNDQLWAKPDLDMYATLRDLSVTERAGEVDARYADVQFVEFRSPFLGILKAITNPSRKLPATPLVRTLPEGRRSISALAKFYYGSASRVLPIRKANAHLSGITNNESLVVKFKKRPLVRVRIPKV